MAQVFKERYCLAFTPDLVKECDEYARLFNVSRSHFFEDAMRIYLKHLEKNIANVESLAA